MGREIKRVPLDFAWPLDKVWGGFVNPHCGEQVKCPTCGGDGFSPGGKLLNALWYEHAHADAAAIVARHRDTLPGGLVAFAYEVLGRSVVSARVEHHRGGWGYNLDQADVDALTDGGRLWDFVRVPRTDEQCEIVRQKVAAGGNSWLPEDNGYRPTAAEVNAWARCRLGHDSLNSWICVKARAARYGVDLCCPAECRDGCVPNADLEARIEAWTETPPPTGEGWQVWETVSEGSPITPVFPTPEGLAHHLATVGMWGKRTPYADALRWIKGPGWAPSVLMVDGRMVDPITEIGGTDA